MELNDQQLEDLLRQLPIKKPSLDLDRRVLASRPKTFWGYIVGISSLAAAAVVAMAILLVPHGGKSPSPVTPETGGIVAYSLPAGMEGRFTPVRVEEVTQVISDEIRPVGDQQAPVREIRRRNVEKIVWLDKSTGANIETTGQSREEVITVKAQIY